MTRRGLFRLLRGAAAVPVAAVATVMIPDAETRRSGSELIARFVPRADHWTSPALPWRGYRLVGSSKDFGCCDIVFDNPAPDLIYDTILREGDFPR